MDLGKHNSKRPLETETNTDIKRSRQNAFIEQLPQDILLGVFEFFPLSLLSCCFLVCKAWNKAFNQIQWKNVFKNLHWTTDLELNFGPLYFSQMDLPPHWWKEQFQHYFGMHKEITYFLDVWESRYRLTRKETFTDADLHAFEAEHGLLLPIVFKLLLTNRPGLRDIGINPSMEEWVIRTYPGSTFGCSMTPSKSKIQEFSTVPRSQRFLTDETVSKYLNTDTNFFASEEGDSDYVMEEDEDETTEESDREDESGTMCYVDLYFGTSIDVGLWEERFVWPTLELVDWTRSKGLVIDSEWTSESILDVIRASITQEVDYKLSHEEKFTAHIDRKPESPKKIEFLPNVIYEIIREIGQDYKADIPWDPETLSVLSAAGISHITEMFRRTQEQKGSDHLITSKELLLVSNQMKLEARNRSLAFEERPDFFEPRPPKELLQWAYNVEKEAGFLNDPDNQEPNQLEDGDDEEEL